uniref:Uncharacterized protein n=1 Tax=Oryza brachyantha TaxID=4533 RepID=J3LVX8_ORYBR
MADGKELEVALGDGGVVADDWREMEAAASWRAAGGNLRDVGVRATGDVGGGWSREERRYFIDVVRGGAPTGERPSVARRAVASTVTVDGEGGLDAMVAAGAVAVAADVGGTRSAEMACCTALTAAAEAASVISVAAAMSSAEADSSWDGALSGWPRRLHQ